MQGATCRTATQLPTETFNHSIYRNIPALSFSYGEAGASSAVAAVVKDAFSTNISNYSCCELL